MAFHDDCLVADGHTDVPFRLLEGAADLSRPCPDRHVDLPRARQGGLDALVWALYVPGGLDAEAGWRHARRLHELAAAQLSADGFRQVSSVDELRRAVAQRAVAVVWALENGRPLLVPGVLDACAELGVRYVTLTHMKTHEWCDASTDAPRHGGLSPQGVELVRAMARRGIVPDVSHVSDEAVRQTVEVSPLPVVASHSSARALCDHPRNLPDELVREIARGGGVVMAVSYPAFVDPEVCRAQQARVAEHGETIAAIDEAYAEEPGLAARDIAQLLAAHPLPKAGLERFVDHVVHLVELAGEEHVGIGSDFDGMTEVLEGFEDVARYPALTAALLERGLDRAGIRLILGENFLRVLGAAEKAAA
ncbi:MAG TPA: membrane dipeptidase [Thermoanaerobaculia bacterium]|nr:membrane dipeptidase [Thermoanaerobaculia bacterium]